MKREPLNTAQKALKVNLDPRIYGTFAEIGAGQEVVRNFFRVGGASQTIAKSISAYDMTFSDAIYGKEESGRYVCESRLNKMLDKEYGLLEKRLGDKRAHERAYFAFSNTVAARNYLKTDMECHGWLGIRFQLQPHGPANTIRIHVRMLDEDNLRQQEALGIIGVNLIYGAYYLATSPKDFVESLLDDLSRERMEVDMVVMEGPDIALMDNRLLALHLLKSKLTDAVLFSPQGLPLLPFDTFYKKAVLIQRGSFRPPTLVAEDMHDCGLRQFLKEPEVAADPNQLVVLKEITMHNLLTSGEIDEADFLARVDLVGAMGNNVMISNYYEYFRLTQFLSRYSKKMIGVVLGYRELSQLFDENHYAFLEGGLLESFGKMFHCRVKVFLYPWKDETTGDIIDVKNFQTEKHLQPLYKFLVDTNRIEALTGHNAKNLHIISRYVLERIKAGDASWEKMVPAQVRDAIKRKGLFGHNVCELGKS